MAEEAEAQAKQTDPRGVGAMVRAYPITFALMALNLAVFAAEVHHGGGGIALWKVPGDTLLLFGANSSTSTIADTRLETLVTACFLHLSILHIGFNLLALYQVGPLVERMVGFARFLPLYLGCGIVGSATSAIWGRFWEQRTSAGASGAICGLIGAALVLGWRTEGKRGPLTVGMARWLFVVLVVGMAAGFDNAAHVGGAVAGIVIAATWRRGHTYGAGTRRIVVGICMAVIAGSGFVVYHRDRTDPFLFLDFNQRIDVAYGAMQAGRCDRAQIALARAIRMDPRNHLIQALRDEFARTCAAGPPTKPSGIAP